MKLSYSDAKKGLSHLQKGQDGQKPPLLGAKGWDKSKVIYHIKNDLNQAFQAEKERLTDLQKTLQGLRQKAAEKNKEQADNGNQPLPQNQVHYLLDKQDFKTWQNTVSEMNEVLESEQEVQFSHKLTEDKFGDLMDGEIFTDLQFAIDMGGEPEQEEIENDNEE